MLADCRGDETKKEEKGFSILYEKTILVPTDTKNVIIKTSRLVQNFS
jgi:hypothetical protein